MIPGKIKFSSIAILVLMGLNIALIFFFSRVVQKSKRIEKAYSYAERKRSIDEHCIDSLFSQLKYSLKILKPQQIVLCTKETKCRSLKIDLNNNNLSSLKIVSLPQCGIDIPLDDYGSSYFFYHY
jgi:hypothetical protein